MDEIFNCQDMTPKTENKNAVDFKYTGSKDPSIVWVKIDMEMRELNE